MVKRRDFLKELHRNGIIVLEHGGRHAKLLNPRNHKTAPIPRHGEINDFTAKQIRKQLGI